MANNRQDKKAVLLSGPFKVGKWNRGMVVLVIFLLVAGALIAKFITGSAYSLAGASVKDIVSLKGFYSGTPFFWGNSVVFNYQPEDKKSEPLMSSIGGVIYNPDDPQPLWDAVYPSSSSVKSMAYAAPGSVPPASPDGRKLFEKPAFTSKTPDFYSLSAGGQSKSMASALKQHTSGKVGVKDVSSSFAGADGAKAGTAKQALENVYVSAAKAAMANSMDSAIQSEQTGFDAAGNSGKGLDYDEKARVALDKLDPKAAPKLLVSKLDKMSLDAVDVPKVGDKVNSEESASDDDPTTKAIKDMIKKGASASGLSSMFSSSVGGSGDSQSSDSTSSSSDSSTKVANTAVMQTMSTPSDRYGGLEVVGAGQTGTGANYLVNDGTGCMHYCDQSMCEMGCYQ